MSAGAVSTGGSRSGSGSGSASASASAASASAAEPAAGGFAAPGWYGKVSMLGDFAQRRLPPGVVQRIDAWLSGWIVDSRARLGERWLAAYLSAPVLRFAWAPGVIGQIGWRGVLMPSCDRSGRYFPLLVAQAREVAPASAIGSPHHPATWFDQLATAATRTLDDDASVEAFESALTHAGAWPDVGGAAPDRRTGAASLENRLTHRTEAFAGDAPAHNASCWWAQGADGIDSERATLTGLPAAADLTRLWLLGEPLAANGR